MGSKAPILESLDPGPNRDLVFLYLAGDHMVSEVLLPVADIPKISQVFSTVMENLPQNKETLDTRVALDCFLRRYAESNNNYDNEIVVEDMKKSSDQVMKQLIPYILEGKNPAKLSDRQFHNIAFYLLVFMESYPGIYAVLSDTFACLMNKLTLERLFTTLGPDFFLLCTRPPTQFISTVSLSTSDATQFFKSPVNFQFPEFSHTIQSRFSLMYQFPDDFPNVMNPAHFALANSVLSTQFHFLDLLSQSFLETITTNEFDMIPHVTRLFPEFLPYLILSRQKIIYSDIKTYEPLLDMKFTKSSATDVVQRFKNDIHLAELVSFYSNHELDVQDVSRASIPLLLQFVLANTEINAIAQSKYFLISDEDLVHDFDFIKAYNIFRMFLTMFTYNKLKNNMTIEQINKLFKSINDKELKEKIAIDLFSVLFIVKNGKFACHIENARLLVTMLKNHLKESKYIAFANNLLMRRGENIENFLFRNPKEIFKSIQKKNWEYANALTNAFSHYRPMFIMSYSVFLLFNDKPLPIDTEPYKKIVQLEFSLESIGHKHLLESLKSDFPQYQKYIDYRLLSNESLLLEPFPQQNKWVPIAHFVGMIEESPYEILSSGQVELSAEKLQNSPFLFKFLHYMELYYTYAVMCEMRNSDILSSVFEFDIRRALSGPFNKGLLKETEIFAQICRIELLPFIFNNIHWFNITEDFVEMFYNKYPNELTAYILTEMSPEFAHDFKQYNPLFMKYVHQNDNKEPELDMIQKVVDMVKDDSYDYTKEIDDYIYRVDVKLLLAKLLECDEQNFNTNMAYLLNQISYVSLPEDKQKLQRIFLYVRIKSTGKKVNPNELIDELYPNNFETALEFITICEEPEEPLIHLISLCKASIDELEIILLRFQKHFNTIAPIIAENVSYLPLLLKCAPKDKKAYVKSLTVLPQEIKENCKLFDPVSISDSFINHPDLILKITTELKAIFTEPLLLKIIESAPNFKIFNTYTKQISPLFTNATTVLDNWHKKIMTYLSSVRIHSIESEIDVTSNLRLIANVFAQIQNTVEFNQIRSLIEFLQNEPYLHYSIPISFENYGEEKFISHILKICYDFDYLEAAEDISSAFDVSMRNYALNIMYLQNLLGIESAARETYLKWKEILGELHVESFRPIHHQEMEEQQEWEPLPSFFDCIHFAVIFKKDKVSALTEQAVETLQEPVMTLEDCRIIENKEYEINNHEFKFYATHCTSSDTSLKILSYMGYFDHAYQLLLSITDEEKRNKAFIHSVYMITVLNDTYRKLGTFILEQDNTLFITKNIWDALEGFLHDLHMVHNLVFVYGYRNKLEEAAVASIDAFVYVKKIEARIYLLGYATYCLKQASIYREKPGEANPPFNPSSMSGERLQQLEKMVDLQNKVCTYFMDHDIEFKQSMDMLHGQDGLVEVCALLLLHDCENLEHEIENETNVKQRPIINQLAQMIAAQSIPDITKYIMTHKETNPVLVKRVVTYLYRALQLTNSWKAILILINIAEENMEKRICLFLEFDFLAEALGMAVPEKMFHLVPLIAIRASQTGMDGIVNQCDRLIQTLSEEELSAQMTTIVEEDNFPASPEKPGKEKKDKKDKKEKKEKKEKSPLFKKKEKKNK